MTVPAINLSDSGVNKEVAVPYVFVNLSNIYFYVWATGGYRYVSTDPNPIYFKNFEYVDVSCLATSFNRTESDTFVERVNDTTIRWSDGTAGTIAQTTTFGTIKGWTKAYSVNLASDSTTNVVTYPNLPQLSASVGAAAPGTTWAVGVTLTASYTGSIYWRYRVDSVAYQWVRGTSATGPWTNIANATSSNYVLTSADSDYYISCIFTASNHRGTSSITPNGTLFTPPLPAPTGLAASNITATSATLSWDAVTNATIYEYAYGTSTNLTNWTSAGSSRSVNLSGLVANTKYYFSVRAKRNSSDVNGEYALVSNFNTLVGAPSISASIGLGNTSFGKVVLYNTVAGAGGGATTYSYYQVQYATWNGSTLGNWNNLAVYSTINYNPTVTSASLVNAQQYKFRSAISDANGNILGEWSVASGAVAPFGPPGAPTITSVTKGSDGKSLTVGWNTSVTTAGAAVLGWAVSIDSGSTWVRYTNASQNTHTFNYYQGSLLTPNTSYTIWVKALVGTVDITGIEPNRPIDYATNFSTNYGSTTATTATTPGNPTGLTLGSTASAGTIYINSSWSAPTSDGGSSITSYQIQRTTTSADIGSWTGVGLVTSYQISSNLSPNTLYYLKVQAVNGVGPGIGYAINSVTTPNYPGTPQGFSMSAGADAGGLYLQISWSAPASNGGSAITGYEIQKTTSSPDNGSWVSVGNVTTYKITSGLSAGTLFYVKVRAVNGVGGGSYAIASATTPNAPTMSSVTASRLSSSSYSVSWSANNRGSAITSYDYERFKGTTSAGVVNTTNTSVTFTGLTAGSHYTRVRARNNVGVSAWMNSNTITL